MCIVIKNKDNYLINEHVTLTKNEEKKLELSVNQNKKYKIHVYFPRTDYTNLNNEIKKEITGRVSSFKNIIENKKENTNQLYSLNAVYDNYKYKNYLSYVFYFEYDFNISNDVWTIVYKADTNEIITINDLIKRYPDFLKKISNYCRNVLKKDYKIPNYSMMLKGTLPTKDNYSNFYFTDDGLIIIFNKHQVSSYDSGNFEILVPYNEFIN